MSKSVLKKVSVIIINYNGMPHIDRCIASVLKQTYQNYEIILVDNASTDGSLEYARLKFANIKIIESKKNLGYAGGINKGLTFAEGEYIAPLNMDTEVDTNWIKHMVNYLEHNPGTGAVTPKIPKYDDRGKIAACGLNIHITGLGNSRALDRASSDVSSQPFKVSGLHGCSFLIKREILDMIGGVNEDCFMYYDDVDLSVMIHLLGYDIYCAPKSIVYHKYQLKMNPQKYFWLESNRYKLMLSIYSPLTLLLCLPVFALTEIMETGYCLIRGKQYLRAKIQAIQVMCRGFKAAKRRREKLKRLRTVSDLGLLKRLQLNYEWGQFIKILR